MNNMYKEQLCKDISSLPENPVNAMAYIPYQQWGETYEASAGYNQGTIFPVLDKPFYGKRGDLK